jgi:hypothetical protein
MMRLSTLALALFLISAPASLLPASAGAATRSAGSEFGYGVLSVAVDLFYGPAKVIYAIGGTIVAGPAWLLSGRNRSVFRAISQPALRGDYVLTPEHLRGERTWRFMGRDPELGPYPSY